MERATVTVEQAAQILGIGRNSAYEAVRRGQIPAIRLGKRLVISRAALERLLSEGQSAVQPTGHADIPARMSTP